MLPLRTLAHTTAKLSGAQAGRRAHRLAALISASVIALFAVTTGSVQAQSADDLDVLRVDLPLSKDSFRNGEIEISDLIAENTYIDVEEFNLRAIELEAHTTRKGEVRLKVGRYVTPPVPLPDENEIGLLRIEAPHKTNHTWRLLIDDRVTIRSLTAVLEPRHDNPSYYQSRYEPRGYTFGNDPYLRSDLHRQALRDNWPYSWLRSDYDYRRRAGHWLWLNDRRGRFQLNPSFGFNHRHSRTCYDRYGRHLAFGGQVRSPLNRPGIRYRNNAPGATRHSQRTRNYLYERNRQQQSRTERRRTDSERTIDRRAPIRKPVQSRAPTQNRTLVQSRERALLQQRAQHAQRTQRAQQQRAQQAQRVQRMQQQRQRAAKGHDRSDDRGSTRRETRRQGNQRGIE